MKLDCSKIKKVFGWRPAFHVREAVELSVLWYRTWAEGGCVTAVMDSQIRRMFSPGRNLAEKDLAEKDLAEKNLAEKDSSGKDGGNEICLRI